MAGMIPQSFIDELVNRVDIVEIIGGRVDLKKAGKEYKACCPFHNEKTPSFTVSQNKQFYHCFGCGANGTALGFLMEYEHMEFVEAVEELAHSIGIEVPREQGRVEKDQGHTTELYSLMAEVAVFYRNQLRQHPQAQEPIQYLKHRGLSGEITQDFGIGYAPPGWDNLLKALGTNQQRIDYLAELGFLITKDTGGHYDRFRARVMFPIHDRRGRVIGFGGRVLGDDTPKYLNSPETPLFHKGRELYGLYEAKKYVRKLDRLLVVEGYMDVVALAQFGIRNVVATLGTATTAEHLDMMYRVVPEVIFCFDGDRAGREAAWRALQNCLPVLREGRQARFLFLPDGEDPDSMVRSVGKDGFMQRLDESVPLSEFMFSELGAQVDTQSMDGRARMVELARPLIAQLPAGVFQQMMVARLEELSHMGSGALGGMLGKEDLQPMAQPQASVDQRLSPVRRLIRLLVQFPSLGALVQDLDAVRQAQQRGVDLFVAVLSYLQQQPQASTAMILEHWRNEEAGRHLNKLALERIDLPEDGLQAEFNDCLKHLLALDVELQREQRLAMLSSRPFSELTSEEREEFGRLCGGYGQG